MFNIGDRVRCIVDHPDNNNNIVRGSTGTVVNCEDVNIFCSASAIVYGIVFVEWDEYVNGHSCDGSAKYGYGWNVEQHQIELEDDGIRYEFDEEKFKELIGF